jgi:hypothetical protein
MGVPVAESREINILGVAGLLLKRTEEGRIRWKTTDQPDTYLFSGSASSVLASSYVDPEGDQNVTVRFLNSMGEEAGELKTTWISDADTWNSSHDYQPGPNNELLGKLFEAARRSALRIDELLGSLVNDLGEE